MLGRYCSWCRLGLLGRSVYAVRDEEYLVVELSPSRVDSDDLTSTSTHKEDPVETLGQDLEELHVCVNEVKKQTFTFT